MNKETKEYFGEVISVYTAKQAIEDGVLMKNPSCTFAECDVITTNLWAYIEERCINCIFTEPMEILERLMKQAKDIYDNNRFEGDNNKDFFVIKGNDKVKPVWFVRNKHNKLTAMLPADY